MAKKTKADDPLAPQTDGSSTESGSGSENASVVDSAKEAASQVIDQVRDQATMRVDQQRQTVASGFVSVADAVRRMSDGLREHDQGLVAHYAAELGHALGDRVESVAHYLRERDVRQLLHDTENFARRSPGTFLGGAFVLGLAASHFLKSSCPRAGLHGQQTGPESRIASCSNPSNVAGVPIVHRPGERTGRLDPYFNC